MWGIYYNELFDSLIGISQEVDEPIIELQEGLTLLKDSSTNKIVGFNLFDVDQDLILHQAFNSFNPQVLTFLEKRLKPNLDFQQQSQFVVGYVETCEEIPNTHLHQTKVKISETESLTIVCGAKNIAQGQYVVVALLGAWMPNGIHIEPGKVYGVESKGMIVSAKELSLDLHEFNVDGIIELPEIYQNHVGQDFFALYQK